ncbi:class I SAM-dependent methyltransferase [Desulfogranum marinum]|uniref:class I SAM-dependent methyltransferase n=1 Tax=Desulfogranum marinum TaxID=453220 RepID=UPI0019639EB3|nr:class I SAM-dependent methyltransferase [Desulfogranum marinum]MBM9512047.1 class I SAM-dependent methyltransferase [Desulfogranum marinum]
MAEMLKKGAKVISKKGVNYLLGNDGKPQVFKPWLGDSFSFLYDCIMMKFIFPKKFGGNMGKHLDILCRELKDVHGKRVLELATGSGSAVNFLHADNSYTGTDISPGLLTKAVNRFRSVGFDQAEFYVTDAECLPFEDASFDVCICILSLNFFDDLYKVLKEVKRVITTCSVFICAVPVPERNTLGSTIRGKIHSEEELMKIFSENGFTFERIPCENGSLLYFRAHKV